jgi:hypothetical protein
MLKVRLRIEYIQRIFAVTHFRTRLMFPQVQSIEGHHNESYSIF